MKGVEKHLTVTGNLADCIVIENDGKYEEIVWPERKPLEQMTPKEILEIVKEAGIVGMGGAGFPTHVKLSTEGNRRRLTMSSPTARNVNPI